MREKSRGIRKLIVCAVFVMAFCTLFGFQKKVNAAIVDTGHQKYSHGEMVKDLWELQKKYGRLVRVKSIGLSADRRHLYEVTIGNQKAKNHLLVIGNLHAREYMTIQLCMKQIEYYLSNYYGKIGGARIKDTLDRVCIHYVPSCNPDGTMISQYGFGTIRNANLRKALRRMGGSTSTWKANARGVDLNRNWNIAFRKSGRAGSMGYHGPRAESEPETKALVNWVANVQKTGKVVGVVSYHSTGSILYGKCASSASSRVKQQTSKMASLAKSLTGYRIMPVESISAANSCSREYFLYKKNIPCITIEVGHGSCPLKTREFSGIWSKNKNLVIREAMLFRWQ